MTKNNDKEKRSDEFINPFVDWSFKRIFGTDATKDLLIGLLNDLLEGERVIEDINYLDKENLPKTNEERMCVFDILCTDKDGSRFLVEMQNATQHYIEDRIIYYTSRLISEDGQKGKGWEYDFHPVYIICLMNFSLESLPNKRTDISLWNETEGKRFSQKERIVMIQIPRYVKKYLRECCNNVERLLFLLQNYFNMKELVTEIEGMSISEQKKAMFKHLLDVANVNALTPEERIQYEADLKHYRDYVNSLQYAEDKGREEGREEGKAEGEKNASISIAQSMKKDGVSSDMISKYTGLSVSEIEKL